MSLQYFSLQRTAENIAILSIQIADSDNQSAHAINTDFLYEFLEVINSVEEEKLDGLIIDSAGKDVFISGIQSKTLSQLCNDVSGKSDKGELAKKAMGFFSLGNQCCRHLARLNCPTLAIINGSCDGVGLEISMACDYRILVNNPKTRLSYPQISQGYTIGFGGISRLIERIGLPKTLHFLTQPQGYTQNECLQNGLADKICEEYLAKRQGTQMLLSAVSSQTPPLHSSLTDKLTRKHWFPSDLRVAISGLQQQVFDCIIDTFRTYATTAEAQQQEVTTATTLLLSKTTRNALYIQQLIRDKRAIQTPKSAASLPRVHILGCGSMGKFLARYCALHGMLTSIHDNRHTALETVLPDSICYFQAAYPDHPQRVQQAIDCLIPDMHNDGLIHADIVIESIQENSDAKASLLLEIEKLAKPEAAILTTTACLPLEEITRNMRNPTRLLGLNMFHPTLHDPAYPACAELMLPAEVDIKADLQTQIPTIIQQFIKTLELLTIAVRSYPGYLGTRLLMAYLVEALTIHEEGIPIIDIDAASLELGMRQAPFILLDEIGLAECLSVQEALADRLGYDVPRSLIHKAEQGLKGKQGGEGFYKYKKGQRQQPLTGLIRRQLPVKHDHATIQKRLLQAIINESRACLKQGLVAESADIDLISVVIIGFSGTKGGTLKYLDSAVNAG